MMSVEQKEKLSVWDVFNEYANVRDDLEDVLDSFEILQDDIQLALEDISEAITEITERLSECDTVFCRYRRQSGKHFEKDTV